ncbi:putative transcriptional regulator (Lrp/AsnC family) [Petrocella atlantisensis]|uniref:Putative transcriptional regulator (Lrp/AsnC family) n=1 Tax=Petrocella atlantisensis TaxID=2173034 RepID=A0A3P7PH97_9FIRM|nr:Lrp/AsnC family transcriptional regulator [Petrocella atlantisensis]MCF8020265.1 Lrp/AsnC family transcriptional regulator [Vallitaleaceae bacterium]PKM54740.1 MAG: AsnC family transcriptional regulator [Firmicutes bacterium HGW-Firmicutes-5]VDN48248.1 putative transcriptional regulator (Lrp/AsnC family) [Petrocella atlantisensis]
MREDILQIIQNNSKIEVKDLALMLNDNEDNIADEISKMEKEKIICGYHTLINWDRTNNEKVTALIEVRVTPQRGEGFDRIAERIYRFKEVTAVYLMSGGFDLTVIIEGSTMKEVALFVGQTLAPLESVLSTGTHFVLKKYKDYGIILDDEKKDERMVVTP